jgi:hypothetical protein
LHSHRLALEGWQLRVVSSPQRVGGGSSGTGAALLPAAGAPRKMLGALAVEHAHFHRDPGLALCHVSACHDFVMFYVGTVTRGSSPHSQPGFKGLIQQLSLKLCSFVSVAVCAAVVESFDDISEGRGQIAVPLAWAVS